MASSSSSSSPEISSAPHNIGHFSYKYASHDEILEDLSSRFILNLPDEELQSVERICFQVEQAHWYYEDFIREENPKYPTLPLKKFSAMLFNACPMLKQWSHDHEQAFNTFMQYKTRVPVCGAIMLNDTWDKCVLVKGWKSSSGWGFPKGKINQAEEPHRCAIREVLEETGYDLTNQLIEDHFIELSIKEQRITLYIVGGIPEDYPFQTRTRKEISKIEWFSLSDLPTWRRNKAVPGKFYLISPFVPPLKDFITSRKNPNRPPRKSDRLRSLAPGVGTGAVGCSSNTCDSEQQTSDSQSSSAENGDPQTPSPRNDEVGDGKTVQVESPGTMDPHFIHLLNQLSVSASKGPETNGPSTPMPAPVPTHSDSVKLKSPKLGRALASPLKPSSVQGLFRPPPQEGDAVRTGSPSIMPNGNSKTTKSDEVVGDTSENVNLIKQDGRLNKHIALLESVASESSRAPTPNTAPFCGGRAFGLVPPPPTGLDFGSRSSTLGNVTNRSQILPPHSPTSFRTRPRTSNATYPPAPLFLKHAYHSTSIHQLPSTIGNYYHARNTPLTPPPSGHYASNAFAINRPSPFAPGAMPAYPQLPGMPPSHASPRATNAAQLLSILNANNMAPVSLQSNLPTSSSDIISQGVFKGISHR